MKLSNIVYEGDIKSAQRAMKKLKKLGEIEISLGHPEKKLKVGFNGGAIEIYPEKEQDSIESVKVIGERGIFRKNIFTNLKEGNIYLGIEYKDQVYFIYKDIQSMIKSHKE